VEGIKREKGLTEICWKEKGNPISTKMLDGYE